jgi:hypothetical protein
MVTSKQDRDEKKKMNPEMSVNLDFTHINKRLLQRIVRTKIFHLS